MRRTIISVFMFVAVSFSFITFGQQCPEQNPEKADPKSNTKTEVVVNERMIEQYKRFMASETESTLWETVKNYRFSEFKEFYATYQNYEFNDDTTIDDIKTAHQNRDEKMTPPDPEKPESEFLTNK